MTRRTDTVAPEKAPGGTSSNAATKSSKSKARGTKRKSAVGSAIIAACDLKALAMRAPIQMEAGKLFKLRRTVQCAKCPWKKSTNPNDIPNGYDPVKHANLKGTIADVKLIGPQHETFEDTLPK